MRTTVTLDPDVVELLRDSMHRSRTSFKEALNSAIRAGLNQGGASPEIRPFKVQARSLGVRGGVDPAGFNRMADELEVEPIQQKSSIP